ncbi:hypothetical protein BCR44DRAFT_1445381 [Catenaria anguillulae PL171]|uniref:Uncharacterized protein n=1 Tax=Catenaria anguillulae PL171 TaxID=765915 RepID=A0A1Y2H6V4_9FUNG|nr:hypothetical protein BCR44DRAFT_1445381 [Catenaria anguillulae PL171]
MNANIPEGLDEALQSKGKRWVETAASDSEAIVKAERSGKKMTSVKHMQRETLKGLRYE